MSYRILAIDDDIRILKLVKNMLSVCGYNVTTRSKIDEINLCDFTGFDLILLDIMMPLNGLDICKSIRDDIKVPILFITAKDMEEDLLNGVKAGADDYITKPFTVAELSARVAMHLNREKRNKHSEKVLKFKDILIDFELQSIFVKENKLSFTKREFDIISLLSRNTQKFFSVEEIYDRIYPLSSDTQFRSVTEYIYQIRNKFKLFNLNPIENMRGVGYRWKRD